MEQQFQSNHLVVFKILLIVEEQTLLGIKFHITPLIDIILLYLSVKKNRVTLLKKI